MTATSATRWSTAAAVGLIPRDKAFGDRAARRPHHRAGRAHRARRHPRRDVQFSAELTDTHADEFSHAVQIGNAITEKKMLDVILQARDQAEGCLFSAITDCGAGGFSSAVGEMGEKLGAFVQLENAPLKYDGLSYTEIWISEAQERMVLAVPPNQVDALTALAEAEDVEWCDLGYFGTDDQQLILTYQDEEVGRLSMDFLHNGIPQPTRQAEWKPETRNPKPEHSDFGSGNSDFAGTLQALLRHPNIASKHWVVRQYDHEVQGGSIVKPLVGPANDGPSDASVIRPKLGSNQGVALSVGLSTPLGDIDPYWMTLSAIDEAVRNAVCVGARPDRIAILDNFCWPSCDKPENLGSLVRAAEACYDGAKAYRTPFISGKDSLNNQFTTEAGQTIAIPPTLLISAMGIVDDINHCVTMNAKAAGNHLLLVGLTRNEVGGSHLELLQGAPVAMGGLCPRVDLANAPKQLATVADLIAAGRVASAHDCSEGGLLVAAAEMAFAGRIGLDVNLDGVPRDGQLSDLAACFAESPSRILIEVAPGQFDAVVKQLTSAGVSFGEVGSFNDSSQLTVRSDAAGELMNESLDTLRDAWLKPLDW
jgi:phosphoribosylformylglycinamidine (FGAM) synthase-like enzyme